MNKYFLYIPILILGLASQLFAQNNQTQSVRDSLNMAPKSNNIPLDSGRVELGRQLFGEQCSTCHAVGYRIMGPALASVDTRRPLDWLIKFIKNSQQVIKGGDEYASFLFEQYNKQIMPPMEFLSDDQIVSILSYIKHESMPPSETGGVNSSTHKDAQVSSGYVPPETLKSQVAPSGEKDEDLGIGNKLIYGGLILVTLVVLVGLLYTFGRGLKR